jgi:hypothetical protein
MQTKRTTVETPQEGPTKTPYQLTLENHLSNTRKQALTTLIEQLEAFIKQTTTWYRNDSDKGYLAILNTLKNTIESPTEGQTISEQLTELVKQVMLSRYRGETVPYLSALQAIEASCKLPTEEKAPDQQQADNDKSITTRASLDTALTPAAANAVDEEQTPICSLFSCFSTLFSSRHKTLPQDDTVDVTQNEKTEDQKKQNKIFNGQLARQLNNIITQWIGIKDNKPIPTDRLELIEQIKKLENDAHIDPKDFIAKLLKLKSKLMKVSSNYNPFGTNRLYRMLEVGFPYTNEDLTKQYFFKLAMETVKASLETSDTAQHYNRLKSGSDDITSAINASTNLKQLTDFLQTLTAPTEAITRTEIQTFAATTNNKSLSNSDRTRALQNLIGLAKTNLQLQDNQVVKPAATLTLSRSDSALFNNRAPSQGDRTRAASAPNTPAYNNVELIEISPELYIQFLNAFPNSSGTLYGTAQNTRLNCVTEKDNKYYLNMGLSADGEMAEIVEKNQILQRALTLATTQKDTSWQTKVELQRLKNIFHLAVVLFTYAKSKTLELSAETNPIINFAKGIFTSLKSYISKTGFNPPAYKGLTSLSNLDNIIKIGDDKPSGLLYTELLTGSKTALDNTLKNQKTVRNLAITMLESMEKKSFTSSATAGGSSTSHTQQIYCGT